jgi:hypothetical protein
MRAGGRTDWRRVTADDEWSPRMDQQREDCLYLQRTDVLPALVPVNTVNIAMLG